MGVSSIEDLRDELLRLTREQLDGLDGQTFQGRISEEEYRRRKALLLRIREVSADYLAALKRLRNP